MAGGAGFAFTLHRSGTARVVASSGLDSGDRQHGWFHRERGVRCSYMSPVIRNARDAEEAACTWMQLHGFDDAHLTGAGADSGVDVRACEAVAQVKAEVKPTTRPTVQRLFGTARFEAVDGLFFALGGYTSQAVEWANAAGVALFTFDLAGDVTPINEKAQALALTSAHPPAPAAAYRVRPGSYEGRTPPAGFEEQAARWTVWKDLDRVDSVAAILAGWFDAAGLRLDQFRTGHRRRTYDGEMARIDQALTGPDQPG